MKKIIYTLIFCSVFGQYLNAQCGGSEQPPCNPGYFEGRLIILSLTQVEFQMRAVNSVVPSRSTCGVGFPPPVQDNIIADITFALKWPTGSPILGLLPQTVGPCTCSGGTCSGGPGGYNIEGGGDVFDGGDGTTIQPFAANGTPLGTPEFWTLNEWVAICTLDVFFESDPVDVDIQLYAHGDNDEAEVTTSIVPSFNFDAVDYTLAVEEPLPLSLLAFNADKYGERSALISWRTSNEINTSHFMVERSLDRYSWEEVGKVQAAGESAATLNYQLVDENVYDGRKPNARFYYRLNMVDRDGRAQKSNIDVVQFSNNNLSGVSVFVFPNPSTDGVNIELNYTEESASPAEFLMYNELGQMVYKQNVPDGSTFEFIDFGKANINRTPTVSLGIDLISS
jgi:hypothetical protein